jgi:hypothetical protein
MTDPGATPQGLPQAVLDLYELGMTASREYCHPSPLEELFTQTCTDGLDIQLAGDKRSARAITHEIAIKHLKTVCRAVAMSKVVGYSELGGLMTVMVNLALVGAITDDRLKPPLKPSGN